MTEDAVAQLLEFRPGKFCWPYLSLIWASTICDCQQACADTADCIGISFRTRDKVAFPAGAACCLCSQWGAFLGHSQYKSFKIGAPAPACAVDAVSVMSYPGYKPDKFCKTHLSYTIKDTVCDCEAACLATQDCVGISYQTQHNQVFPEGKLCYLCANADWVDDEFWGNTYYISYRIG